MDFAQFGFAPPLHRALARQGYETPTPIQAAAIPPVLAGRDVIGCAQTGTGKTAAFALPLLHRLLTEERRHRERGPRALVVAPTRELADQIRVNVDAYAAETDLRCVAVYGGVGTGKQIADLERGVDVLVACPGRLLDLMGQGRARLDTVETLILDEADRMLDMGFAPDIRRVIAAVPARRQTLLFSATMPDAVRALAASYQDDPVAIAVTPEAPTAETVVQRVYHVERGQKTALLQELLRSAEVEKTVVFTRTKHGADRLGRKLERAGIRSRAIHGNKSQGQRTRAMDDFRDGTANVLVASDIAARGLDVAGISHVINFDLPREAETYVHRIGRCGRAGASGMAWSLCAPEEHEQLRSIERGLGHPLEIAESRYSIATPPAASPPRPDRQRGQGRPPSSGDARPRRRRSRNRRSPA